ncbi:acyl-CoA dehydrogenase family protein [Actibacterium sp. 188UL27-1]|uniref:acyl-CoA dehydrogenase family protein n=1 Tax=Actibacterium sp. 188UL27-1 TaxID=2786961 RepID=UPI00351CA49C
MVSLLPTEDEIILADSARSFLDEVAPVSRLRAMRDAGQGHDHDLWQDMSKLGWAGVLIPKAAGGADMGYAAANILSFEMGKTLAVSPFISTSVIAATVLRQLRTDRANRRLTEIAKGDLVYALAFDGAPKHLQNTPDVMARPSRDGFLLSGPKTLVMEGGVADRLLVSTKVKYGYAVFDIAATQTGLSSSPMNLIDGRDAVRLGFKDVWVSKDDLCGEIDQEEPILKRALLAGYAAVAAELSGIAAGVFALTIAYLKDRQQFGRPIGSFQALQHRVAHLWCEMEVTASTILNAGRMLDSDPDNADLAVSLAKVRAIRTARLAVGEAIQMHGGIGMTDALDLGFYMKRARVASEWLGDESYHTERVAQLRGL